VSARRVCLPPDPVAYGSMSHCGLRPAIFWKGDIDTTVAFPDAFPLLLIAQKSLDNLNSRLSSTTPKAAECYHRSLFSQSRNRGVASSLQPHSTGCTGRLL
jgi:hypothetical protein